MIDEVIVWDTIVWAVNVPLTKKLSAEDAVSAFLAQLAVPNNELVIEVAEISSTLVISYPPRDKSPCIALVPSTNKYCWWSSESNPSKLPCKVTIPVLEGDAKPSLGLSSIIDWILALSGVTTMEANKANCSFWSRDWEYYFW